jgi:AraC family transcriptional regulator
MNSLQPSLRQFKSTELVGMSLKMSFLQNRTHELWSSFMPRKKEIGQLRSNDLFSVEVYEQDHFVSFNPARFFEKWACVETDHSGVLPEGMKKLLIPEGLYAVFTHRGTALESINTYRYIFEDWLPASHFSLDSRPHFAVMGEKYKHESADSEEEVWIPVRLRQ